MSDAYSTQPDAVAMALQPSPLAGPVPAPGPPPPPVPPQPQPAPQSPMDRAIAGTEAAMAREQATMAEKNRALAPAYGALSRTLAQPIPQPPTPQKVGQPPMSAEQKNPLAFVAAMAVLGAVASVSTRGGGQAALASFTGAVNGWQQGNLEAYETNARQWEQQTKATLQNNAAELARYRQVLENRQLNIDQQMSQIQVISAQFQDKLMLDAAAAKNYTMVAQLYEKKEQWGFRAKEAADKLEEKRNADKQKLESTAAYWLSPEGVARRAALTPEQNAAIDTMVKLYAAKGVGKSSIAQDRQQFINEYTDEHGTPPTSAQVTQWEAERAGVQAEATAVGRRAGGLAVAVQEAHDTVPNVLAAAEKSAGRGLATWNKIENRWKVEKGDADFAYYVQQMNSLINVYGRVISGGGKGTVSDLEHAREMLNPNMPLSAVKGSLRGFSREIDIAEKAPEKVRARMRGGAETPAETPPDVGVAATAPSEGWGPVQRH